MYALFKQATSGKPTSARPGMMDFVGRAKWDAWNGLGDMSQDEARLAYVKVVDDLVAEEVCLCYGLLYQLCTSSYSYLQMKLFP